MGPFNYFFYKFKFMGKKGIIEILWPITLNNFVCYA